MTRARSGGSSRTRTRKFRSGRRRRETRRRSADPAERLQSARKGPVCVWTIQKNSLAKGVYKFILEGKNDNNDDLDKLDPDIEVDR